MLQRILFSVFLSTLEVKSSSRRIFGFIASARASIILCFCPPERLVPRSETIVSSFSGSDSIKSVSSAVSMAFFRDSSVTLSLKAIFSRSAHVENYTVLKNKTNLSVEYFFRYIFLLRYRRIPAAGIRRNNICKKVEQLALSCRRGADNSSFASGFHRKGNIFQYRLISIVQ